MTTESTTTTKKLIKQILANTTSRGEPMVAVTVLVKRTKITAEKKQVYLILYRNQTDPILS